MNEQLLWCVSTALCALSVLRLSQLGLIRRAPYNLFALMQAVTILRDIALLFLPVKSISYTYAWALSLPLVLVSQGCAGVACYVAVTRLYPKIGRFAAEVFAGALIVAVLVCLAGLPLELPHWSTEPIFRSLLLCYRWIDTLLAGGILLAVGFLAIFPTPLKKLPANLLRHTRLLASYFAVYAITAFLPIQRLSQSYSVRSVLVCLLYATWSFALSKRGEESEPWPMIDPEVAHGVIKRARRTEQLYHQAAAEMLRLQVSRPE